MRNITVFVCVVLVLSIFFLLGCAATVYVPESPPPPKAEVKPPAPGPHAVWIDGTGSGHMADMCGFRDIGSRNHMAHGCPDTRINDPTVGYGLRTIGLDRMKKLNAAVVKIDNGATPITLIKGARALIFLYLV